MMFSMFVGDSYRIQTCNLLIRSQMLYSVELMSHSTTEASASCLRLQRYNYFLTLQIFILNFFNIGTIDPRAVAIVDLYVVPHRSYTIGCSNH